MLYLDTEFNGFGGPLISLALTSDDGDHEFYGVLPLPPPGSLHPWVEEHVRPFLGEHRAEPYDDFRHRLAAFLKRYAHDGEPIIADWPDDFVHLLQCLREDGGVSFELNLELRLVKSGQLNPVLPHNALSDARALKYWYVANEDAA